MGGLTVSAYELARGGKGRADARIPERERPVRPCLSSSSQQVLPSSF